MFLKTYEYILGTWQYLGRCYYSQLLLYRTENFSPAQKQLTVCFVQSGDSDTPDFLYTGL